VFGISQLQPPDKLITAPGGNAIHPAGIRGTGTEQVDIAAEAANALLPVLRDTPQLAITRGNGPGFGMVLLRQALT